MDGWWAASVLAEDPTGPFKAFPPDGYMQYCSVTMLREGTTNPFPSISCRTGPDRRIGSGLVVDFEEEFKKETSDYRCIIITILYKRSLKCVFRPFVVLRTRAWTFFAMKFGPVPKRSIEKAIK
jgi:hypothetical protein